MTETEMLEAMNDFEQAHDIHIYACRDFGSRAKNMDGPDSDKDALFLFDQSPRLYKRLDSEVDNIVTEKRGIDFQGWNTKKFAELVADSNPTAIEWLNSPERYYEWHRITPELRELQQHATENFRPIALYYHYRSLAERQYRKHIKSDGETTSDPTAKRNLIALRAIACAEYINEKLEFPPLNIDALVDEDTLDSEVTDHIEGLRLQIASGDEGKSQMIGNQFGEFIEEWLDTHPDQDRLEINGIDRARCNQFIDKITDAHESRY
jgi:predicted nucleotidyltransferase